MHVGLIDLSGRGKSYAADIAKHYGIPVPEFSGLMDVCTSEEKHGRFLWNTIITYPSGRKNLISLMGNFYLSGIELRQNRDVDSLSSLLFSRIKKSVESASDRFNAICNSKILLWEDGAKRKARPISNIQWFDGNYEAAQKEIKRDGLIN